MHFRTPKAKVFRMCPWYDFWFWHYIYIYIYIVCLFISYASPLILFPSLFLTYLFPLRIDPLHFQAGCRKRRLNLALVFCVVVHFFWFVNACICCAWLSFAKRLASGNISDMTYFVSSGPKNHNSSNQSKPKYDDRTGLDVRSGRWPGCAALAASGWFPDDDSEASTQSLPTQRTSCTNNYDNLCLQKIKPHLKISQFFTHS